MSKLSSQWIDLFRAGDYGDKGRYTEQDIQQVVDNYDPSFHEAPAVIGHPKEDAPAYGWWEKLRRNGGLLQGKLKDDVDSGFEKVVLAGRFKKRSVKLYHGAKGLSLRHVGFLGAHPPEIKGLADIKFGQEDEQAIEIEFSEETSMADMTQIDDQQFGERLNSFFSNLFGKQAVVKTFSEEQVRDIAAQAAAAAVAPVQAQLDAQKKTFSETSTAQQKFEAENRAAAAIARVKAKGAWVPAFEKMGVVQLFGELASDTVTVEFGEGAEKKTQSPLEIFTTFMESLKAIVPTAEVYTGKPVRQGTTTQFNETVVIPADPNSVALDSAVKQRMADKQLDYGTALGQVSTEKPELCVPGGATSGAV